MSVERSLTSYTCCNLLLISGYIYIYILRHAFVRDRLSLDLFGFVCSFEIERLRTRFQRFRSDIPRRCGTPKLKTSNRLSFEGMKKRRKVRQIYMYNNYDKPYLIRRPFRNLKKKKIIALKWKFVIHIYNLIRSSIRKKFPVLNFAVIWLTKLHWD